MCVFPCAFCDSIHSLFRSSHVQEFSRASLAHSTRKAYDGAWKRFRTLASARDLCALPCSPKNFNVLIADYAHENKKFHAVKLLVAAVSFFHRSHGFDPPSMNSHTKIVMRGIKKCFYQKPKRAKPWDGALVASLVSSLLGDDRWCSSFYDVSLRRWRTAASIIFSFAALCRFNDLQNLCVNNLSFEANKVLIFIPRSKTDQCGEGQLISLQASGKDSCPVAFIKAFVRRLLWEAALEGSVYSGPLFPSLVRRRVSGPLGSCWSTLPAPSSPVKPFSYQAALMDFRSALADVGVKKEDYSLHSGRRGGATEAVRNGCDLLTLKRQGRWRSDSCPQLYVDDVLNGSSRFSQFLSI